VSVSWETAPWPIRNAKAAHGHFQDSLKVAPVSTRNNYFCGLSAFALEQYEDAAR
jgi:hypothetical protein